MPATEGRGKGIGEAEEFEESGEPFPWLFAYFREVYPHRVEQGSEGVTYVKLTDEKLLVEALHLAYTRDGRHWTALNGNRPVLQVMPPFVRLRDPFLGRGADGVFHLVATSGEMDSLLYTCSRDLISWDVPRGLAVMRDIPETRNVWAPEFVYDRGRGDYFLFWSSSQSQYGWDESRIWYARTPDFQTLSPPCVLFDPGFSVIDATLVQNRTQFVMFFKDERFGEIHGERRAVRMATSHSREGPYELASGPITPVISEGPAVARMPDGATWALYYDRCMDDCYQMLLSSDLVSWHAVDDASFPPHARHGSVLPLQQSELDRLLSRYPPDLQ